jgi:FAD/FMN-containing dehydrogenase
MERSIDRLLDELSGIPSSTVKTLVRQKSRDFFWYSPVLNALLRDKTAEAVLMPRDEADVLRIAAACVRHRVPITARGSGTGNYGQAVPLEGGVVVDMTALDAIEWQRPGMVRVGPGRKMIELDRATRSQGSELRMHPSTKRTATIGGFVAGGSGGIGSITWGGLREPGNVGMARIVTMEETPRVLELRDADAQAVNHAYGTTGLITALEMPLAPAWDWVDLIVAFPDFMDAVRCGHALALSDGIVKKLASPIAWPIPESFMALQDSCPQGQAILIATVAAASLPAFKSLLRHHPNGAITYERPHDETAGETPLYEYTWNHTTLQMLKRDRGVTYLQALHPAARLLDSIAEMHALFGDEVMPHLEFIRVAGQVTASGLPVVRFTDEARLREIIAAYREHGVSIADPHTYTLEDGAGHKRVDADQLSFKRQHDPHGLLNPGKMRSFQSPSPPAVSPSPPAVAGGEGGARCEATGG